MFLRDVEAGLITLTLTGLSWEETYAGNVEWLASNGWRVIVFNDCDSWDYIDSIVADDGRYLDFFDFDGDESGELSNYSPRSPHARKQFGQ